MNHIKKHRFIYSVLTWFIITSQIFTQVVYADSLATPKISHPEESTAYALSQQTRFAIYSALRWLPEHGEDISDVNRMLEREHRKQQKDFGKTKDPLTKDTLDHGAVQILTFTRLNGKAVAEFTFANKPELRYKVTFDIATGEYEIEKLSGAKRDMAGKNAPSSDLLLKDLIRDDRVIEIYADGEELKGNVVEWLEKYVPGKTPPEMYRGEEVKIADLFSTSELANIKIWIREHPVTGPPIKFRIILEEPAIGWRNKVDSANIAHAGYHDQCVYIGHLLLKYMMANGDDRVQLRTDVLERDELQHLKDISVTDSIHEGPEYDQRLKKVGEAIERIACVNAVKKNPAYLWDREFKKLHDQARAMIYETGLITPKRVEWLRRAYAGYLEGGPKQKRMRELLGLKENEVIVYDSMEFAIIPDLPFFAGGLGALAGDHGRAGSDLLPDKTLVCVGGYYEFGYLTQKLDDTGWQKSAGEVNKRVTIERFGELAKDADGSDIVVGLPMPGGKTIYAKAWKVQAGRTMMLFLTSDISENNGNPDYRNVLKFTYDGNEHTRLLQEYTIGVGGEMMLDRLGLTSRIVHLNEGHVAFAILEKARQLLIKKIDLVNKNEGLNYNIETLANVPVAVREKYGLTLMKALEAVRGMVDFTSHTPVIAGNQVFQVDITKQYLDAYLKTFGASFDEIAFGPMVHTNLFDMTEFVLTFCHKFNAVARKHADVCREMYKNTNKMIEECPQTKGLKRPEVFNVTNAVSRAFYQPKEMSDLLERKLDGLKKAEKDPLDKEVTLDNITWKDAEKLTAAISDNEMAEVSCLMLTNGLKELESLGKFGHRTLPVINGEAPHLNPEAFIVVFGRRMAGYKQADFVLNPDNDKDMMAWRAIVAEAQRMKKQVQIVYMGKAHDTDAGGKSIIQKILHIAKTDGDDSKTPRPSVKSTILFIENYNTRVAQAMVKIATAALNNPIAPLEASGTSGMKFLLAGKPSITIMDGWTLEAIRGVYPFVTRKDFIDVLTGEWRYQNYAGTVVKGGSEEARGLVLSQVEENIDGKVVNECLDPQCRNVWSTDKDKPRPEKCPKCGSLAIKNNSYHELGLLDVYFNHKERWYQIMRESLVQGLSYFTSHRMFNEYAQKIYAPTIASAIEAENKFMHIGFDTAPGKELRGNIKNGLETIFTLKEFFATGVTFEDFKKARQASKNKVQGTASREELNELENLGLAKADKSGKTYRYSAPGWMRGLSGDSLEDVKRELLAIEGLNKRRIIENAVKAEVRKSIEYIIAHYTTASSTISAQDAVKRFSNRMDYPLAKFLEDESGLLSEKSTKTALDKLLRQEFADRPRATVGDLIDYIVDHPSKITIRFTMRKPMAHMSPREDLFNGLKLYMEAYKIDHIAFFSAFLKIRQVRNIVPVSTLVRTIYGPSWSAKGWKIPYNRYPVFSSIVDRLDNAPTLEEGYRRLSGGNEQVEHAVRELLARFAPEYVLDQGVEEVLQAVRTGTNQMHQYIRGQGADLDLNHSIIIMKKGLPESTAGVKALSDPVRANIARLIRQGITRLNGKDIIEVNTPKELADVMNDLMEKDKDVRMIILDDDTLTRDLDSMSGIPGVRGKFGENYCAITTGMIGNLDVMSIPFINIQAMAMMGVGILYDKTTLFEIAYDTFTGRKAPRDLVDDVTGRIRWLIRALPRIVRFTDEVSSLETLKKLFETSA